MPEQEKVIRIDCPLVALWRNVSVLFNGEEILKPGVREIVLTLSINDLPRLTVERTPARKSEEKDLMEGNE